MPVLVEANSVIVRRDTIDTKWPGGWEEFQRLAPAKTLCTDGEIVRVGFDDMVGMVGFLGALRDRGLKYGVGPAEDDVATLRVEYGPDGPKTWRSPCDWIVYVNCIWTETGWQVMTALLKDGQADKNQVVFPVGWNYETSPSRTLRVW